VFRAAFAALAPGGVLAFDVRKPSRPYGPTLRGTVARDWVVVASSTERDGRLERSITTFRRVGGRWRRTDEVHRLTLLPTAELVRLLRQAGFVATVRRGWGRTPLPAGLAVLVARKPARAIGSAGPRRGGTR
jgi:hypothetical protein